MEERKNAKTARNEAPHNLIMENRRKLSVSGVNDVESFNEDEIILITESGGLSVKGSNLHISKLSIEIGEVSMEGEVDSICYADVRKNKGGSILSRMFR